MNMEPMGSREMDWLTAVPMVEGARLEQDESCLRAATEAPKYQQTATSSVSDQKLSS